MLGGVAKFTPINTIMLVAGDTIDNGSLGVGKKAQIHHNHPSKKQTSTTRRVFSSPRIGIERSLFSSV